MIPRKHHLRPDGGHGGNGGSVILVADPSEQSLKWSHPHVQAEKGSNGTSKEQVGRNGKNLILRVPCGVVVRKVVMPENEDDFDFDPAEHDEDGDDEEESGSDEEQENGDVDSASWNVHGNSKNNQGVEFSALDEEDTMDEGGIIDDDEQDDSLPIHDDRQLVYLADLDKPGAHIVVAQGGRGGRGTMLYRSKHGPLPDDDILVRRARADPGEVAFLELELKLIADIGLVGYPNAGTVCRNSINDSHSSCVGYSALVKSHALLSRQVVHFARHEPRDARSRAVSFHYITSTHGSNRIS